MESGGSSRTHEAAIAAFEAFVEAFKADGHFGKELIEALIKALTESLPESPPTKFVGLFVCDMESSGDFPMLSMILGGPDSRFIYVEGASKEAVWAKAEQVCAEQWEYMCGKPRKGRSYFDQVEVGKVRGGCLFGWEIKEVPMSFSLPGREAIFAGPRSTPSGAGAKTYLLRR